MLVVILACRWLSVDVPAEAFQTWLSNFYKILVGAFMCTLKTSMFPNRQNLLVLHLRTITLLSMFLRLSEPLLLNFGQIRSLKKF